MEATWTEGRHRASQTESKGKKKSVTNKMTDSETERKIKKRKDRKRER